MSRPRFFADQNFNENIVDGVMRRESLVEWVLAREVGLEARPDPEVIQEAARMRVIVLSHDMATMRAEAERRLQAGQEMHGLFLVHQFHPIAPIIENLLLIWTASEAEEWIGQVRFLPL